MEYTEASIGRIFILRLHQNDIIHEAVEKFAKEKQIQSAMCFFLGGAEEGSKLVVGPKDGKALPPQIQLTQLMGVHEGFGVGTLFQNEHGEYKLHMHGSFGRNDLPANAVTGCVRTGVTVWKIAEVVLFELKDSSALRKKDAETGFEMLEC